VGKEIKNGRRISENPITSKTPHTVERKFSCSVGSKLGSKMREKLLDMSKK